MYRPQQPRRKQPRGRNIHRNRFRQQPVLLESPHTLIPSPDQFNDGLHSTAFGSAAWQPPASHAKCPECLKLVPIDLLVTHISACLSGDSSKGLVQTAEEAALQDRNAGAAGEEKTVSQSQPSTPAALPAIGSFVVRGPDYSGAADGWSPETGTLQSTSSSPVPCLPLGVVIGHTVWGSGECAPRVAAISFAWQCHFSVCR